MLSLALCQPLCGRRPCHLCTRPLPYICTPQHCHALCWHSTLPHLHSCPGPHTLPVRYSSTLDLAMSQKSAAAGAHLCCGPSRPRRSPSGACPCCGACRPRRPPDGAYSCCGPRRPRRSRGRHSRCDHRRPRCCATAVRCRHPRPANCARDPSPRGSCPAPAGAHAVAGAGEEEEEDEAGEGHGHAQGEGP